MKDKILNLLKNSNDFISGEYLSEVLNVSRNSIWKHINNLKKEGYEIVGVRNKGYKLISSPDILNFNSVNSYLKTKFIGHKFFHYENLDSTNLKAKEIANIDSTNGIVVVSETQSNGTGRFNRHWQSPKGGIWASLILRPNIHPSLGSKLTLIGAASLYKVLDSFNINCKIKWPNDIYINNKKISGILTLMNSDMDTINYIILGIGININLKEESFKDNLNTATSLLIEKNKEFNRGEILALFLNYFEYFYNLYVENNNLEEVLDILKENQLLLNKEAYLVTPNKKEKVIPIGLDSSGELLIKDSTGNIRKVISGEITFKEENTQ